MEKEEMKAQIYMQVYEDNVLLHLGSPGESIRKLLALIRNFSRQLQNNKKIHNVPI